MDLALNNLHAINPTNQTKKYISDIFKLVRNSLIKIIPF